MQTSPISGGANRIDLIRPDAPALAAFGEYAIGVRTDRLVHPDQIDVRNVTETLEPRYDRPLVLEIWYPAVADTTAGTQYHTLIRDGVTKTTLTGRACREAVAANGRFPLVILSHGYPGNRLLMAHLSENLASKGYVVAAIDHTDSLYEDYGDFGSTLVNRPLDQRFAIDALNDPIHPLAGITDTENVAVIGYSMGAYGALVFGGAGVSQVAVDFDGGAPQGLLAGHMAGSRTLAGLVDPRVKCIVPIGPWGAQRGVWQNGGLAGLAKPALIIGGSRDVTSGYRDGIRRIFEQAKGTQRHLLTFEGAGHNAAAPIPAPVESWIESEALGFSPFEHYADTIWDNVRMNNIAQHFVAAFLRLHLKADSEMAAYLGLTQGTPDPSFAPIPDGADWPGFPAGSTLGLRFETLAKGM
ncbi:MAG TPA: dienelactone hydrolase [Rhodobacteraceae bacterium]|nr:dienelactone hydrolase [Paracoccaceae bacterium]